MTTELEVTEETKERPLPPPEDGFVMARPEFFMKAEDDKMIQPEGIEYFQYWQTPVSEITGGRMNVTVVRSTHKAETHLGSPWHYHEWDFAVSVVTKGWAEFEFEGVGKVRLEPGMIMYQASMNRHREIYMSPDFEGVEINVPARVPTTFLLPGEGAEEWKKVTAVY